MNHWRRYLRVAWRTFGQPPTERLLYWGRPSARFLAAFDRAVEAAPRQVARNERIADEEKRRQTAATALRSQFDGPFRERIFAVLDRFRQDCGERAAALQFESVKVHDPRFPDSASVRIEAWLGEALIATIHPGVARNGASLGVNFDDSILASWIKVKQDLHPEVNRTPSYVLSNVAIYVAHKLHGITVRPDLEFGMNVVRQPLEQGSVG